MSLKTPNKRVLFVRRFIPALLVVVGVFSLVALNLSTHKTALAATSNTVNFQARLQTASGAIVPDGNYNIEFKLYSASSGGSALWTEDYYNNASHGIVTKNGYISANLGSLTAFSGINWDQQLWLTMNVGGTTTGSPSLDGEMSPRLQLTAVPYAFTAGKLSNTSGVNTSTLSLAAPTGGNQNFVIQDQGAAGTYNLLTNNSGVQLQSSTPGTAQTGYFNISGTGIAGTLQASSFDRVSSGTLSIGETNATTINIATNAAAHTINIGTGAAAQAVTVGSQNSTSSTAIQGGTGGIGLYVPTGGTYGFYQNATMVFGTTTNGASFFKPLTDGADTFQVQNATGSLYLNVNTSTGQVSTGGTGSLFAGTGGITTSGALSFSGTGVTNYTTPLGTSISTKINVPNYDPGAFNQIIALGLPSSANSTARAITILDARTAAHQPSITVLSPDENQVGGFSWDGSDTNFGIKTSADTLRIVNSGGTGLDVVNSSGTQVTRLGQAGVTNGALQIHNSSNGNSAALQAPSVSTSYITNLPAAIGTAGQCLAVASVAGSTQSLGYSDCLSSATGVQLQAGTPGTAQTGNLNITGTAIAGTALQAPLLQSATATALTITGKAASTWSTTTGLLTLQGQDGIAVNGGVGDVSITSNGAPSNFTIGNTGTTGTITVGQSTDTNTIAIGSAATTSGKVQTITIGAGTPSGTGKAVITIGNANGASSIALNAGTGGLSLGDNGVANTVQIGNTSGAVAQTINLGNNATASSTSTVTVGSTVGSSTTNVQAGTGNVNLLTNSASAGVVAKTNTNSTAAFQLQNSNATSYMTADSVNQIITTKDFNVGSSANTSGQRLFSDSFESGNTKLWSGGTTVSGSGALTLDTSLVRNGKYALKAVNNSGAAAATTAITGGTTTTLRSYVYVTSHTSGTGADIMYVRNGANLFGLSRNLSNGKLGFWNGVTSTATDTSTVLTTGAWHEIELVLTINASTGSATVYLDGANVLSLTGQNTGSLTPTLLQIGDTTASGHSSNISYDDVVVDTVRPGDSSSLNVNDSFHVGGSSSFGGVALFQGTSNSTNAFQIQNAGGTTLFNIDTATSTITLGSGSNTVTIGSTGEPVLAGTARHAKKLILTPEYTGAVLDASTDTGGTVNCSTTNNGTMTSGYVSTGRQNYYNWSSSQASAQCYDVVLQVQLPSDWAAWNGASSMFVYNSVGTDSTSVAVNVIDTTGTNDTAYSATSYNGVSSGTSFAATNLTGYTGTYAADGYMTLKIRMTSNSSKNVRIGNITLNYLSKY